MHPSDQNEPPEAALRVSALTVRLSEKPILTDVRFEVDRGRFVGLLGPNGSGKTTLLRTLAGLLPYRGSARFFGREIHQWPQRDLAQHLAFVRQMQPLPFDFRVEELVLLGRTPHLGLLQGYSANDRRLASEALEELDVAAYHARSVRELSGGELQRVLLAQALVQRPDVLLLDEPTAHLDVHHQYSFLEAIRRQVKSGKTVIAVFHDLELAARFSDLLVVLHEGICVAVGDPFEVLTERLLYDVFLMRGDVKRDVHGHARVHYLQPLEPRTAPSTSKMV